VLVTPEEGLMLSITNQLAKMTWKNVAAVTLVIVLLVSSFIGYKYLTNTEVNAQAHAITIHLSKRLGVPYNEAFAITKSTLLESRSLPEHGGFFENIWYGSPRARYLENTIETKLRRSGFSGFWLGSEVRASVRSGLREAAAPQNK
jgi:hypothetical protein